MSSERIGFTPKISDQEFVRTKVDGLIEDVQKLRDHQSEQDEVIAKLTARIVRLEKKKKSGGK